MSTTKVSMLISHPFLLLRLVLFSKPPFPASVLLLTTEHQSSCFCSTPWPSPSLPSTSLPPEHGNTLSALARLLPSSIPAYFCSSLCCGSSPIHQSLLIFIVPCSLLGERKYSHAIPPVSMVLVEVCWTTIMTVLTFVSSVLSTRYGLTDMCPSTLRE